MGRRCSRRRRSASTRSTRRLGGLTPAKRHAAQLAADALHRALAAAAASGAAARSGPRGRARRSSPCPAASTAPSPRCSSASEGRRWSASPSSSGPIPRPTAPRPAARQRPCSAPRGLAHSLGIPHFTLDLEEEFRRRVVGRFIDGYAAGRTPNPCVLCNGEVRIAAMIDLAERLGADRLVTGHYARIVEDADGPLLAAGRRLGEGPELHACGAAPGAARPALLPAHRPDQAGGAGDRRAPRPARRPQGGEPGPLLPRRAGQARLPAPPRRAARPRGRGARCGRPRRRPPPRPPQLHGRPAARHRRLRSGAALRPRHRRDRQHGHRRRPR